MPILITNLVAPRRRHSGPAMLRCIFNVVFALLLTCLTLGSAHAATLDGIDLPEEYETRYKTLINELRCLVCQNETLADSNAELAADLRREVRGMLVAGKSDTEITEFLVARYGDFVLYNPPVKPTTLMLWYGPFALLVLGVLIAVITIRRRGQSTPTALNATQHQQVQELLNRQDKENAP